MARRKSRNPMPPSRPVFAFADVLVLPERSATLPLCPFHASHVHHFNRLLSLSIYLASIDHPNLSEHRPLTYPPPPFRPPIQSSPSCRLTAQSVVIQHPPSAINPPWPISSSSPFSVPSLRSPPDMSTSNPSVWALSDWFGEHPSFAASRGVTVTQILIHPLSSAKDQLSGTSVAIKKIMKPFSTPVLSKRTYRELKLLKHLRHENVSGSLSIGGCVRRLVGRADLLARSSPSATSSSLPSRTCECSAVTLARQV